MSILSVWKITVFALLAGVALGWYVQGLRWDSDVAERGKKTSENISASQQAIIAGHAFQFQRFNEIARQTSHHAINIKGQSDEKQIIYRTIIKRDPAGRQCVHDDVASRLLDYTYRLRASTMHTTTSGTDTASAGPTSSDCRLTYEQAVYWIDPLLTAIDQANSQLGAIRETESNRATQ